MPLSCPLRFTTLEPCARRGEPVTVGLPWPQGAVTDERRFQLVGPDGSAEVLQTKVLDRWPDGSVRWCLFDFLATWDGNQTESGYRVEVGVYARTPQAGDEFLYPPRLEHCAERQACGEGAIWQYGEIVEPGPIRQRRLVRTISFGHAVTAWIESFRHLKTSRVTHTFSNPNPSQHPGGNWDLGNAGAVQLKSLEVRIRNASDRLPCDASRKNEARTRSSGFDSVLWNTERFQQTHRGSLPFVLQQHSSGGENWKSTNHVDRTGAIPLDARGYTVRTAAREERGLRSTPVVIVEHGEDLLGVTMVNFWENFPKAIFADEDGIRLRLFPTDTELQGGEQKTHTFFVAYGRDTITDEPMVWCRSPIVCHADPEWYAASGAIPYLTPLASDPHAAYLALVDQAIDGPDTFLHKREKIDEYGWRNFGDLYGDHEAVFHRGQTPLVSHYNNQYDCVAAFLEQFFRSGDVRWLTQGLECADHTCDIDVYHTDGDKAAYNRGLFWHTYHYADADTGTHRAYPKSLTRGPVETLTQKMDDLGETAKQLQKSYAVGGGPASSHNYNAGLMLAYFLTGNPLYRDTALDLANFVLAMEDPRRTPFRFLSREFTGLATESGGGGYHGPGRAAANSILALLVGHRLTGDAKYLTKAEQLIRRVVHPKQDPGRLDLLNAELRWFYTMTLQALGVYLDHKIELGQLDRMYAYARLTLLHYARWMAAHERPILDTPERLQYPTETWAAQDVRKVEVFQFAAKHATGAERERFLERAAWFFDYVQTTLSRFETKSLTRPVILMMRYGWSRNWWRLHPTATAPEPTQPATADDFGDWRMFVPQKVKAIRRAKAIIVAGGLFGLAALVGLAWWLFR